MKHQCDSCEHLRKPYFVDTPFCRVVYEYFQHEYVFTAVGSKRASNIRMAVEYVQTQKELAKNDCVNYSRKASWGKGKDIIYV